MSSQNSPESALEIRGLEKTFYTFHLGPLDLTVPVGAVYGLIGPNGAGKTTTIDLVVGLGRNDSGTIKVLGFDHIRDEVELKKRVGYVSPDLDFLAWRTVGALISFICAFYPEWDFDYCENLLARFHLLRDAKISELSLGERTKLALTLVLPRRPPLLLLDEPTIGLDAISKKEFFAEILKLVEDGHHSVLISSHGLSDIERFADHIGIIHQGKMLSEGRIDQIMDRFSVVDFTCTSECGAGEITGCRLLERDDSRYRVLIDRSTDALEAIRSRGAQMLHESPLSLEELFVALVKE